MTNTSSIACGARSCIVDAPHLSAPGGRASTKGGSAMRRCALLFAFVSLCLPVTVLSQARTPDAAIYHFNNANKKIDNGDFDGAIEELTRAIRLSSHLDGFDPSNRRLGNSFTDYSSTEIKVIDPFTARAYNNRGLARYKKHDYAGAIEDYDEALRIRPGLPSAYLNRAASLRAMGQLEASLKDLDRAIAVDQDFYEAFSNRGSLKLDLGDTKGALEDLNRSIELNDRIPESFYQRGYAHYAVKKYDAALADFERAEHLDPKMAWAYQGHGTVLMAKGQMPQAIDDFTRAIELNPQIVWAYVNRGISHVYLGNESEAQKDLNEALRLRPDLKAQLDDRIELARQLRQLRKPVQ